MRQPVGQTRGQSCSPDARLRTLDIVRDAHEFDRARSLVPDGVAGARITIARLADAGDHHQTSYPVAQRRAPFARHLDRASVALLEDDRRVRVPDEVLEAMKAAR